MSPDPATASAQPWGSNPPSGSSSPYAPPSGGQASEPLSPYAPGNPGSGGFNSPYAPPGGAPPSQPVGGQNIWNQPTGQQPAYDPYQQPTGGFGAYPPQNQPNPYQQPTGGFGAYPPQNPYQQSSGGASPYPFDPAAQPGAPRKRSYGLWLVIIGVLLLVGAGIAAVIIANNGGNSSGNSGNNLVGNATPRPTRTPEAGGGSVKPTPTSDINIIPTDTPEPELPTATPVPPFEPGVAGAEGRLLFSPGYYDDLQVMPAAGGVTTTLPFTNVQSFGYNEARFAPDGVQTVYYRTDGTRTIVLARPEPDAPERIVAELPADLEPYVMYWSPDSTKVAFVTYDYEDNDLTKQNLYVVDIPSATLIQTTQNGYVSTDVDIGWSPQTSHVLYGQIQADDDSTMIIHVSTIDGSSDKELFTEVFPTVVWLPDGRIVYDGYCATEMALDLCAIDGFAEQPKGEQISELGITRFFSGMSPQGSWAMLQDYSTSELILRNLATGEEEVVAESAEGFRVWSAWSPDERFVTFRDFDADITFVYEIGSNQPAQPLLNGELLDWLR